MPAQCDGVDPAVALDAFMRKPTPETDPKAVVCVANRYGLVRGKAVRPA